MPFKNNNSKNDNVVAGGRANNIGVDMGDTTDINKLVQEVIYADVKLEGKKRKTEVTALGSAGGGALVKKLQKKSQKKSPIRYASGRRASY